MAGGGSTTIFTGSPLNDPNAVLIGQFTALLSQQTTPFQAAVASVRAGLRSHQSGYASMPFSIELIMADGTRIQSQIMVDSISSTGVSDRVRLSLSKWDGPRFTWCIVDITGDDMAITVHRNPPEIQNEWRSSNPTIVPPNANGINA